MHSWQMDFRRELANSLNEIIGGLEGADQRTAILRLEVLYETALIDGDVPLDAIDLIDQARKQLVANQNFQQPFHGYQAPLLTGDGRRGRPKFSISEEQILFFRGIEKTTSLFLVSGLFLPSTKELHCCRDKTLLIIDNDCKQFD